MRWNCAHTFFLEADNQAEFDAKLAHYRGLVRAASDRLGIGYGGDLMWGRPQVGPTQEEEREPNNSPEALFDE